MCEYKHNFLQQASGSGPTCLDKLQVYYWKSGTNRRALDGVLALELFGGLVAVAAEVASRRAVVLLPGLEAHPAEVVLTLHIKELAYTHILVRTRTANKMKAEL